MGATKPFLGHTIHAFQIAKIRKRNPKIIMYSTERILYHGLKLLIISSLSFPALRNTDRWWWAVGGYAVDTRWWVAMDTRWWVAVDMRWWVAVDTRWWVAVDTRWWVAVDTRCIAYLPHHGNISLEWGLAYCDYIKIYPFTDGAPV
jgi:hypothetical protein